MILDYMERLDRGEPIERELLMEDHPEHAAALLEYLQFTDEVEALLRPDEELEALLGEEAAAQEDEDALAAQGALAPGQAKAGPHAAAAPTALAQGPEPPRRPARDAVPTTGATVGGWLLGELLHRGGRSALYAATRGAAGAPEQATSAVKLLLWPPLKAQAERDSFCDRAKAVAAVAAAVALGDPGLAPLLGYGIEGHLPYLVTPFFPGGDLRRRALALAGAPLQAVDLVIELAQAIERAHDRGVVHGNLKPANVLWQGADGPPVITDFQPGPVLDWDEEGQPRGPLPDEAAYLAPEQLAAPPRPPRPAVDVYALGAILYELLCGAPPYAGDNPLDTILLIVRGGAPPPRARRPELPALLSEICAGCLARDPKERPPTIAALREALQRFRQGPAPGPPRGSLGWLRRTTKKTA